MKRACDPSHQQTLKRGLNFLGKPIGTRCGPLQRFSKADLEIVKRNEMKESSGQSGWPFVYSKWLAHTGEKDMTSESRPQAARSRELSGPSLPDRAAPECPGGTSEDAIKAYREEARYPNFHNVSFQNRGGIA